jgi:hypothetical protein
VYPADATPGHLLSVVPVQQLAMLHQRQKQQKEALVRLAAQKKQRNVVPKQAPPAAIEPVVKPAKTPVKIATPVAEPAKTPATAKPKPPSTPPPLPAIVPVPSPRYTNAIRSQQQWLRQLQGR